MRIKRTPKRLIDGKTKIHPLKSALMTVEKPSPAKRARSDAVAPSMTDEDIEAMCQQLRATAFSPVTSHFYD